MGNPDFLNSQVSKQQNCLLPFLPDPQPTTPLPHSGEFQSLCKHIDYSVAKTEAWKFYSTTSLTDIYFSNSVGAEILQKPVEEWQVEDSEARRGPERETQFGFFFLRREGGKKKKEGRGAVNRITGNSLYPKCQFLRLLLNNLENIQKGICKNPFRNDNRGNFQSYLLPFASCSASATAKHQLKGTKTRKKSRCKRSTPEAITDLLNC